MKLKNGTITVKGSTDSYGEKKKIYQQIFKFTQELKLLKSVKYKQKVKITFVQKKHTSKRLLVKWIQKMLFCKITPG